MPTDFSTLEMGPCIASFKGTGLGLTKGGVEVEFATEVTSVSSDQFGDTIINDYIKGRSIKVKVPIAENDLSKFSSIFPGTVLVTAGSQKKLLFKTAIGTSLRELAGPLILHPKGRAPSDTSADFAVPLAMTKGEFSYAYKHDEQRVYNVEFHGYADLDTEGLFIMGSHDLGPVTPPATLTPLTMASPAITENTSAGSIVASISGKTAGSTLTMLDDAGGRFSISGENLTAGATPTNFEAAASHSITIRETLAGATNSPRDTTITVNVSNVFEQPSLQALTGSFSLAENAAANAVAGAIGSKTAGSTLSLVSDAGGRVALSGTNIVRGATSLDYEVATSHSFTVRETLADSANSPRDTVFTLNVTDIDEVAPTITSANPSGFYAEGSPVSGTLTANETVTWSKSGTDAALVTLNTSTGAWSITSTTDFETKSSYSWTFIATDSAGNSSSQIVDITITDVAESLPTTLVREADGTVTIVSLGPTWTPTLTREADGTVTVGA